MRELKDIELKNIELFELGEISKSDLHSRVVPFTFKDFTQILYNLEGKENTTELFESFFWFAPTEINSVRKEVLFQKFLLENWHFEHSEIVSSFQIIYNNNILNINTLILSLDSIPKYLQPNDFKYPYIRKIIYAIGAQPEPYNIDALEKLASVTDDNQIKELALHQIEKRKKLGRWEFNKNKESEV